jgi:type II secretory pathway pseudopilin PulG
MDLPLVVTLLVVAVVLAVLAGAAAVTLGVVLSRTRRDQQALARELAAGRAEQATLRARLDGLAVHAPVAHAAAPPAEDVSDFVITTLPGGAGEPLTGEEPLPGRSFVTVAAGESLVRAATLVQGLRRALAAESRNRIRFEMAREVKRARKQRRRDLRDARRRPRAAPVGPLEEDAA